jgi:hypothetical protein
MPRNFLDLEGAAAVQNDSLRLVARAVRDLIRRRAIGAVFGDAGLGKSFSTEAAVEAVDGPVRALPLRLARHHAA